MPPATRVFLAEHHLAISTPTVLERSPLNDYNILELEDGLTLPRTSWLKMDASYDVPARLLRPYLSQSGAQYRFTEEACNEVRRFVKDHLTTIRHIPFHCEPSYKAFTPNKQPDTDAWFPPTPHLTRTTKKTASFPSFSSMFPTASRPRWEMVSSNAETVISLALTVMVMVIVYCEYRWGDSQHRYSATRAFRQARRSR